MRFRTLLCAVVTVASLSPLVPANAGAGEGETETHFGNARVFVYNDGEVAAVSVTFGPAADDPRFRTTPDITMTGGCDFATEASVNQDAITIDVTAYGTAGAGLGGQFGVIWPISTGVECRVKMGNGVYLTPYTEGVGPLAVAAGWRRYVIADYRAPLTLCARPSVHWSDNTYQVSAVEFCG